MANNIAEAILIARYYAGQVDGVFPGLKDQLAEDVVLDWFGMKMEGNGCVASFMLRDYIESCHKFDEIGLSMDIMKEQDRCESGTNKCLSDEAGTSNINDNIDDTKYDNVVKSDDLSKTKVRLGSERTAELELKEEMESANTSTKRRCYQEDKPILAEDDTMKYIEAKGEIMFKRKSSSFLKRVKSWNVEFRLQIAYSHQVSKESAKLCCTLENEPSVGEHPNTIAEKQYDTSPKTKSALPNLEEILKSSMGVEERTEYMKSSSLIEDHSKFLKHIESEIAKKNSVEYWPILHFMGNKPVLNDQNHIDRKLPINYRIHRIVYESLMGNA